MQDVQQVMTEEITGGLYARCNLRDYFLWELRGGRKSVHPGLVSPAATHGDPMTSLKRTFAVLANPMIRSIPHELRRQLLELSALYSTQNEEDERLAKDYVAGDDFQQSRSDRDQEHRTGEEQEKNRNARKISAGVVWRNKDTAASLHRDCRRVLVEFQQEQYKNAILARRNTSLRGMGRTSLSGDSGVAPNGDDA